MDSRGLMLCFALLGIVAGASLGSAQPTPGISFTVNSAADVHDAVGNGVCETAPGNGICTLRAAVEELNLSGATPREVFLPALTFVISLGQLSISGSMLLQGAGMGATVVDSQAGNDQRFIDQSGGTLTLRDLAIYEFDTGAGFVGGAIRADSLVVERCRFELNNATSGGAIHFQGQATVSDSIFSFNSAVSAGGAIYTSTGVLEVQRSVFESNSTAGLGGAISSNDPGVAIYASLFVANEARDGGAVRMDGPGLVVNSTFHANRATGYGGAIRTGGADHSIRVINSTFSANVANSDLDGWEQGGGIYVVVGNDLVELWNSILAGNIEYEYFFPCKCYVGWNRDCAGNVGSNGFNVVQSNGYCTVTGAVQAVDPLLLPLAYNGGSTRSQELASGSPARNAGRPIAQGGCVDDLDAPLTTDQRGAVRPYGGECDLGAVEHGVLIFSDDFEGAVLWSNVP